ncbi:MAG: DegQ family serine endoprotease [Pseudomonadota bacterium]
MNLSRRFSIQQSTRGANVQQHVFSAPQSWQQRLNAQLMLLAFCVITLAVLFSSPVFANQLPDYADLVEEQSAAVVRITALAPVTPASAQAPDSFSQRDDIPELFKRYFDQMPNQPGTPRRGNGFGSGFIVSDDGYVVTNAHVVDGAETIRVSLHDKREFDATLIGADERTDVALLKIDAENLPQVELGDSDEIRVGQWVLAIGSPFGFEYTATQGIVSAVSRHLRGDSYVPFIQTDAAVNPGNSGGPLFDAEGRVIGVNSQIYTRSGGFMGLSFAIPVNVVKDITDQLKSQGYASYGWLGVMIQDLDAALAESFGLDRPSGALVAQVTDDSPAQDAGLQSGDIILTFAGKTVEKSSDLPSLVGATRPGKTANIEIVRMGERLTVPVTIRELDPQGQLQKTNTKKSTAPSLLGLQTEKLSADELAQLNIDNGVRARNVERDGPAAKAGIQAGDIIVSINQIDADSPTQLDSIVQELPRDQSLPVLVLRNSAPQFIAMTIPKA